MINMYEVSETNKMIEHENLDVRTTRYALRRSPRKSAFWIALTLIWIS